MTTPDEFLAQVRQILTALHDEVGESLRELRGAELHTLSRRQRVASIRLGDYAEKIFVLTEPSWMAGADGDELLRIFKEIVDDQPRWNALAATLER